jgi:hypothetical protein
MSSLTASLNLSAFKSEVAIFLLALMTRLSSPVYNYWYSIFTFCMQVRELSEFPIF